MPRNACAVPFTTLDISPDGTPVICCQAPIPLTVDGRPASVGRDSLEAIWDAPELVSMRAAMARGEKPEACRLCWEQERVAPVSLRTAMNDAVYSLMGTEWSLSELMHESGKTGFRSSPLPRWYQLQLGNTCNLKCRSCSPVSSSRIAADRVHRAWSSNESDPPPSIIPRSAVWFRDPGKIAEMVGTGDENIYVSLLGGEPFLIPEVWELLELLVERGSAKRIDLGLVSNGTRRHAQLERLVPEFRSVYVSVSIDGYGPMFEYLRHGARWSELVRNLEWLQAIPGLAIGVTPTLQNANALGAVKLLRFLDERELNIQYNVLSYPERLRATNLPSRVRRIATQRLQAYLDEECRPANRPVVRGWVGLLDSDDPFDPNLFAEFMEFTNDLDASRSETLADADPELFALLRASGVHWSYGRRHATNAPAVIPLRLTGMSRTIDPRDVIHPLFEKFRAESYFESAAEQVQAIELLLQRHGHEGLAACRAVADFASHYGRHARVLRSCLPHTVVYACDIDRDALEFCERELGSTPVLTSWRPDEDDLPHDVGVIICISLLTHTPLEHWRRTLRAWEGMLEPGGIVVFTYLSERYVDRWVAGGMVDYGPYPAEQRASAAQALEDTGFAFVPLPGLGYEGVSFYGATFAKSELVRHEVAAAGLELLELDPESEMFEQAIAVARKPGKKGMPLALEMNREVRVVALYDPRSYADGAADSTWPDLVASQPPRPLPTELGFCDPRVAEVREGQAALAREHGIDAFCFLYPWSRSSSRRDAALRELLATGRPAFPFCLMWTNEEGTPAATGDAEEIISELLPYLSDPRYLRLDGRPLLLIRDLGAMLEPRATVTRWRTAALAYGVGEIHVCAAEPIPADSIEDLGVDSALELPRRDRPYAGIAAKVMARERPAYPLFRSVLCQREPFESGNVEHYELWLRSAIETSTGLVFVSAWNDWTNGAYLEPDDRDGRDFLAATRRAVRGPGSGLVLLRRLRDSLGPVDGPAARILDELDQVVSMHERSREELTALVEAAFVKQLTTSSGQRWVPVAASHLPPSPGRVSIDQFGAATAADLRRDDEPMMLDGEDVTVLGWAHSGDSDPSVVSVFLVLTSLSSPDERVYRLSERTVRPDVAAAFPDYPARCGFAGTIPFGELQTGTYRVGIVQRTPDAAHYDPTPIRVKRA